MKEKRDRMQIVYDILQSISDKQGKIKPTHLLYKSNLSHGRLMHYIEDLIQKGLITKDFDEDTRFYVITDKGLQFLAEYRRMREFTDSFGL
jgi:predicted transcriptional regulator